jgi:tartrate dehydrogenase/decarboxylase / D-malate dehydrogenase
MPETIRVIEAAGRRFSFYFLWQELPRNSKSYLQTDRFTPQNGLEQLKRYDAIYLGAVG